MPNVLPPVPDSTEPPAAFPEGRRDAFLSHASADATPVRQLLERLRSQSVSCWIAPDDVVPGRSYAASCVHGIEISDVFILFATPTALASVQVLAEMEQAHKRSKPIFALMAGRPKLTSETDYYLSRLHWLDVSPETLPVVADRIAEVIRGRTPWPEVATSRPTIFRRLTHRRDALVGSIIGSALVLLLAVAGVAYERHRDTLAEDLDPNQLGLVSMNVRPGEAGVPRARMAVYLNAPGVRYADVHLIAVTQGEGPDVVRMDLSPLWNGQQQGGAQVLEMPLAPATRRLTACLVVPHPRLHQPYRVTWVFGLRGTQQAPAAYPIQDAVVRPEDGGACGESAK